MKEEQLTLDSVAAREARDKAMGSVSVHADADWKWSAENAIRARACLPHPFTSEEILSAVGHAPGEHRAIGPILQKLYREGVIKPTGRFVQGKSVTRHGAPIREWIGG